MGFDDSTRQRRARIRQGGAPKYHAKNAEVGKLFARERLARLLDEGSFTEDGTFAHGLDRGTCGRHHGE
jgi:acetyl-CoA carboxylase carboxyltransferase component